ncbi:MAG TPA: acyl-CoA thioesterase [Clostridiales bacterium]|nr:acyl-CoA thioesterase [Clostridiales bacterium]
MDENTKFAQESHVEMTQLVMPNDTNSQGNLFGGTLMKWIDLAGAMVAMRHTHMDCVTVSVDNMDFHHSVKQNEIVTLKAGVTWTGNTSMEIKVDVFAEDPYSGKRRLTNTAYIVLVALDKESCPVKVPQLKIISDNEKEEWDRALERRKLRMMRKNKI